MHFGTSNLMESIINFFFIFTVKVGVVGFSMGAAAALYSASCWALKRYGNGAPYTANLRVVAGLNGWLPASRCATATYIYLFFLNS